VEGRVAILALLEWRAGLGIPMSEKAGMPGCHSRCARMASLKCEPQTAKAMMPAASSPLFFSKVSSKLYPLQKK
jgi:hypothetical protein